MFKGEFAKAVRYGTHARSPNVRRQTAFGKKQHMQTRLNQSENDRGRYREHSYMIFALTNHSSFPSSILEH